MQKIYIFIIVCFWKVFSIAQIDTLHVHYFPSNQVSTIAVLTNNFEGYAKAFSQSGEEIYSSSIRRFAGHESVEFKHYESGGVREAKFSSAPDAGIQWYKSKTTFDEAGKIIGFHEDSHEQLIAPQIRIVRPEVQEVAACASIHENKIIVHNHIRQSIEYVLIQRGERNSQMIKSKQNKEVATYISAEITQEPTQFYKIEVHSTKRFKKKFEIVIQMEKRSDVLTFYHYHIVKSHEMGKDY